MIKLGKKTTILTNCIREIKTGRATLAECLNRYPSLRRELEPLLTIATNIQELPALKLDSNFKQVARVQLLAQTRTARQQQPGLFTNAFNFGSPSQLAWARVVVAVLVALVLITTLAGGTAYAAQASLPGDLLYPVKIGIEDTRLRITASSSDKVGLYLQFAHTRLLEIGKLGNVNEVKTKLALNGYQSNLDALQDQIDKINDSSVLAGLLNRVSVEIQNQVMFCDKLIDDNPAQTGLVRETSRLAVSEQVQFLNMQSQLDLLQATRANLDAMQNRLQRAQDTATTNRYQTMQEVLLQYQQFSQLGEQFLARAQNMNNQADEIEKLSLEANHGNLNILNSISEHVPQEYQNIIQVCTQATFQFQTQAQYRFQHKDGTPQEYNPQSSGNDGGSNSGQGNQDIPQDQGGAGDSGSSGTQSPYPVTTSPQGTGDNTGSGGGTGSGNGSNPTPTPDPGAGNGSGPTTNPTLTPSPIPAPDPGGNAGNGPNPNPTTTPAPDPKGNAGNGGQSGSGGA